MAVTVRVGNTATEDHPTGGYIKVHDGHLHVFTHAGPSGTVVAIYAPDNWRTATVKPDAK